MKRSFFSTRLYLDGIRQLKLMGVLFTVANCLVSVAIPVMNYLSYLGDLSQSYVPDPRAVTALDMNPLVILLFCAYAPIMTLFLFSFLNKRESSDFYHALPETRSCIFFSFFAAVITWVLGILVVSSAVATAAHALFPELYLINYGSLFYTGFNCFAGAFLVCAAVAIAMSVTGTTFINILLALIIIFFPRILVLTVTASICSAFPLVDGLDFVPILSAGYNVPVGTIFSVFDGEYSTPLTQWQSGVYTLVVAILYTAVAVWLFTRRHSESAGRSAPSRRLQGFYRFLIGFIISSITTLGLFSSAMDQHGNLSLEDIGGFFFIYVLAVFAMLVFEALCAKTFRRLFKKALVTVSLLVAANVVLFVGMFSLSRFMYLYTPDAEDIVSVRLIDGLDDNYYYNSSSREEYFITKSSNVELTDEKIRTIVARQLEYSVDLLEISRNRYYKEAGSARSVPVAIFDGFTTHYRKILLYSEDLEMITARLQQVDEYLEVYSTLPESVNGINVSGDGNMYLNFSTPQEMSEFYSTVKREFEALPFETRYGLLSNLFYEDDGTKQTLYLYADLAIGGKWQYFNIPISIQYFPETYQQLVTLANAQHNGAGGLKDLADAETIANLGVYIYHEDGSFDSVGFSPKIIGAEEEISAWLQELQTANATVGIDTDRLFYYVEGRVPKYHSYDGYDYEEIFYFYAQEPSGELPQWLADYLSAIRYE